MGIREKEGLYLGIDAGSVSVSLAVLDSGGKLVEQDYRLHRGELSATLTGMLDAFRGEPVLGIAATSGNIRFREHVRAFDVHVSLMEALEYFDLDAASLLHVGAERFFLTEYDSQGKYLQTNYSSSCAAGTGSFLDQQAMRLRLGDAANLSDMALANTAPIPDIAARCSVFAKTDLIHAQQQGYGLEAICDSLCKGLADNIADTLFNKSRPKQPILMTGGVSRNRSVVGHLEKITGMKIHVYAHSHQFPVIGAARLVWKESTGKHASPEPLSLDVLREKSSKVYFYEPLSLKGSAAHREVHGTGRPFRPVVADHPIPVQVERFGAGGMDHDRLFMGIDVGSTSTKAVLLTASGRPFSGYYTYTSGRPLKAVQAIFEAMADDFGAPGTPEVVACATTGSGRKFIGSIIGADQDVDEITAHARAAYELEPLTDTIIEIGGQDAKFTQMKDGTVTFSHMNTVCAAGTGSFIEEMAGRLGVALEDIEKRAQGHPAPLASDRCTVFMERDVNQLLSQGYSVDEVLATVVHSVRENYLKKVAGESLIGNHICFQGATARNGALVAAFEQRLGKPVHVSAFCHLTGALGAALILREEHRGQSGFRGLELYRKNIPVRNEVCDLCLNRCSISVAGVNGTTQAYGFLCGRDYDTPKFVKNKTAVRSLMDARKRLMLRFPALKASRDDQVIGIPGALHMAEDLVFWKRFFSELAIPFRTSETYKDSLKTGKKMAGAEFCAPIDSMYGHVGAMASETDLVFFPVYLEARSRSDGHEENFCYYTQFSASLASMLGDSVGKKLISPMLNFRKGRDHNARILQRVLKERGLPVPGVAGLSMALKSAGESAALYRQRLENLFEKEFPDRKDVSVVLLGRPYVVLSEALNKGIPGIFERMGICAYYQDMVKTDPRHDEAFNRLLEKIPWHFAAWILRVAERACRTPGLYPVLVTAFKCAPDSFIVEYFKQLMNLYGKPYLVIQIDEHDSNTGYETRIEAALRSFRNHARGPVSGSSPDLGSILPRVDQSLEGKTVLMPNWDTFVGPLVVANLRRAGYDARLLESSEMGIRKSMVHNTGQCLPISIIAQEFMDYIEKHHLDPSRSILWMMEGHISCNLRQYPYFIKRILEKNGAGMEKASVYTGEISHREISLSATYYVYFAYMLGGLFRKTACRIRPYEEVQGSTDQALENAHAIVLQAISGKRSIDSAVREGLDQFDGVRYDTTFRKPLVAIFGDLYVRDNDTMNQDLVRDIENAGGEVLVTPYHDYSKIVLENVFRRAVQRGEHVETSLNRILLNVLKYMDDRYYKPFSRFLGEAPVIRPRRLEKHLKAFNVDLLHSGESYDNILKIFYIIENYPDVALFVQTNPSYCCPALVTEAMTARIREITGVPVVTITYDGTGSRMNEVVVPYIRSATLQGNNA